MGGTCRAGERESRGVKKEMTAKVIKFLVFDDHVIVDHGRFGYVVDARNFIAVLPKVPAILRQKERKDMNGVDPNSYLRGAVA